MNNLRSLLLPASSSLPQPRAGIFAGAVLTLLLASSQVLGQGQPKAAPPSGSQAPPSGSQAPPSGQPQLPPTTSTDMEIDPDRAAETPAQPPPDEPAPLPPVMEGSWGVGGKEEEGRFVPKGKTGALKEEPVDPEDAKPIVLGPPGQFSLDTVIGFGDIRDPTNAAETATASTKVTVFSIIGSISYRIADRWTLMVRLPYSNAATAGPQEGSRDDYNAGVIGNLELTVKPAFQLTRRIRIPVWVSFYFPFAPGDYFAPLNDNAARAEALINQAAISSRGYEENALFASSRISFVPGAGLDYERGPFHAGVFTKFEIMAKSGGNEATAVAGLGPPELRNPAFTWVIGGEAFHDFAEGKVSPGLRTWFAVTKLPVAFGTNDYSGPQFVVEPAVRGTFPLNESLAIRAGLGIIIPIGGHLGGAHDAAIKGLRLNAALLF